MRAKRGEAQKFYERALVWESDECLLWPFSLSSGYGQLNVNGRPERVHVLVAESRIGSRPDGMQVCHRVGCSSRCVNVRHLRYDSPRNNALDRHADGTMHHTVLTAADVLVIFHDRSRRGPALAEAFGISLGAVKAVRDGRSWGHVTKPSQDWIDFH